MKVLSGIDRVFFSASDSTSFLGAISTIGYITDNEGEYTREIKTIKLADGQELTTCTEYMFKFETADSLYFDTIRGLAEGGLKYSVVALSETGGCLVWFNPATIFVSEVTDQKSGDLKKLRVTVNSIGTNLLPINYGNNLFPPYIANCEDISLTTVTGCTKSNPNKNVGFTEGVGKVIQLTSTTGSTGYLDFTFNFPAIEGNGIYYAKVDNNAYGILVLTAYDYDGSPLATDTYNSIDSNEVLEASLDMTGITGVQYIGVQLGVFTGVTAQFDNLRLSYNLANPVMD